MKTEMSKNSKLECLKNKNKNVLILKTKMSKYKKFKTKCLNTEN